MLKGLSILKNLYLGFGIIIALLLALIFGAYVNFSQMHEANRWLLHTHEVVEEIDAMSENLLNATRGARSYALTGDGTYRDLMNRARDGFKNHIEQVQVLTADNPRQQKRLQLLQRQRQQWQTGLIEPLMGVRMSAYDNDQAARQTVRWTQQGRSHLEAIRSTLRAMRDEENRLLSRRSAAETRLQRLTEVTLMLGALFVLVMATLLFVLLARNARQLSQANRQLRAEIIEREQIQQELRESEVRFRRLADSSFEGLSVVESGRISDANSQFAQMFGYDVGEPVGMQPVQFVSPESQEMVGRMIASGHEGMYEAILLRKDGTTFPAEIRGRTIPFRGHTARVTAIRDITQRKEVERMKNEFISTVSHELRTPLTSIRGSLGLLVGGVAGPLPDSALAMTQIAYKNSERLVRLINDILDIEKIESGKMTLNLQTLPIKPLLEATLEANRAYADELGVQIKLETEGEVNAAQVEADSDRLTQVLTNLLSNAAKFSPRDETVTVTLSRHIDNNSTNNTNNGNASNGASAEEAPAAPMLRVTVDDRGSGIPDEFRARIFQKFAQADSSDTRQKGGTGLGLSISKAIIEQMGGHIGFRNREGGGTIFFFELPEKVTTPQPKTQSAARRSRILICEDDADVATLLGMMLQQGGFDTDVARDAQEARTMLAGGGYDGMTLDLMLPGQDGVAFLREMRNDESLRDLPVVVVSARASQDSSALDGEALGVADWLDKPIDATRLVASVRRAARPGKDGATGRPRILHVEDDPDVARVVQEILQSTADVEHAASLSQARDKLQHEDYDVIVLDLSLPDGMGWELMSLLQNCTTPPPVVVFSASEIRPEALQNVAASLLKSRTSNSELLGTITSLLNRERGDAPVA